MRERPWTGNCHRCGKATLGHIMSMLNAELICMDCKAAERKRPDYKQAEARDLDAYATRMGEAGCTPGQVASVREQARKLREGEL